MPQRFEASHVTMGTGGELLDRSGEIADIVVDESGIGLRVVHRKDWSKEKAMLMMAVGAHEGLRFRARVQTEFQTPRTSASFLGLEQLDLGIMDGRDLSGIHSQTLRTKAHQCSRRYSSRAEAHALP